MQLVFSDQNFPTLIAKSLFLAGPSPRRTEQLDWRHAAISYLDSIKYNGHVFIPIPKNKFYGENDSPEWTYDNQIHWEETARQLSDLIVFYVDRTIDRNFKDLGMPGFTTNVEFGLDFYSGKIVYGRPTTADKCNYLDTICKNTNKPIFDNLSKLIDFSVAQLGLGSIRENGEIYIPLFIWKTLQFQDWYANLKLAGNRLENAKLLHHVKFSNQMVFCYLLSVNIWIEKEQRYKSNEFVFSRTDISSVVAYYPTPSDIKIVLVKEFRSPVNNSQGYVYELPGGSSVNENVNPQMNAQHELSEEIGLTIDDFNRFKLVATRQLMATLSSHKAHVYSIKLTLDEIIQLENYQKSNKTFGLQTDTEITSVEVVNLSDIFQYPLDYSMLGMIYEAIKNESE
jgi:8-oxo-dGTP pyrophosphatase MutT (NUDIX family)